MNSAVDSPLITKRILLLTIGGIIGGRLIRWIFFDRTYDNLLFFYKALILLTFGLGAILGVYTKILRSRLKEFYFSSIWFLVSLRTKFSSKASLIYSQCVLKTWDYGWNEQLGPQGLKKELRFLARSIDLVLRIPFKAVIIISFLSRVVLIIFLIYHYSL
jgi:hypothetical protein